MRITKNQIKKRNFEAQILTRAADQEDDNTIDIVFSTGQKGLRSDWSETYYEELEISEAACDLSRMNAGAPFMIQHANSVWTVLGVVERAWIEDGKGMARIRFSKRSDLKEIIQDIKDGILRNVSVGYRVLEYVDKTVKGDKYRTLLAVKWVPFEASSVAVGFDSDAQTVRSDDAFNEVAIHEPETEEVESQPAAEETTPESQATNSPNVEEEIVPTASEGTPTDEQAAVEAERCDGIKLAVRTAGLEESVADDFIKRGLKLDEASSEIFKIAEAKASDANKTKVKEQTMNKRAQVIEALMYRSNPMIFKIAEDNELKGRSLIEIFQEILPKKTGETDANYAQRAIVSTDIANVLLDASNKIVDEYEYNQDYAYRKLAKPMTMTDFKDANIVDVSGFALGEPAAEGGDYPQADLTDSKEKMALRQRGILLIISLKSIINDDLGMLSNLPQIAQTAGFDDVEAAFFKVLNTNPVLSDTKTLFHADHKNLIPDGTGVDVLTMDLAEQLLASQEKLGKNLKLKPKYLLVHPKHQLAARRLVGAQMSTQVEHFNPYAGVGIEVIVSSLLNDEDSFYVFADPKRCAAIATGTMVGMETPRVSSKEEFSSSNFKMKVEYHNNAGAAGPCGVVKVTIVPETP